MARAAALACCLAALGALRPLPDAFAGRQPRPRDVAKTPRRCAGAPRFLPPLEVLEKVGKAPSDVLPCFPLPLHSAALPGAKRTLRISEKRYVAMYQDMLAEGRTAFVVPRCVAGPEGTCLAEAAVVFRLQDLQDAPTQARHRYVCSHQVEGPVRITRVLNPEAWQDQSSYLRVECTELSDPSPELDHSAAEQDLLAALTRVVQLFESAGDALRRFELSHDARGRPWITDNHLVPTVTEKALETATLDEEGFWRLAALWQGYLERRALSLRQAASRAREAADREAYASDSRKLAASTADLMQRLLQTAPRGMRLAQLLASAEAEADRLAAASALRAAVGAEPFA